MTKTRPKPHKPMPPAPAAPAAAASGREFINAVGIILIVSLVGYGHLLTPGKLPFNRYSDFIAQHLTTKTVVYESLRQGRGIPFWRNDQFSGYLGLTNAQTMYTYPMHLLYLLLPPVAAVGPTDFLHFLVAAGGFYALASVLGLSHWARVFLAIAGMFNFKLLLATYAGWTPVVPIIAWLPSLLAAVLYVVRRPGPLAAAILALVGGMCFHCGQIQQMYYFTWFAAAYIAAAAVRCAWRRQWGRLGRTLLWPAAGAVLAVALAAYLMMPLAVSSRHSTRADTDYDFFLAGRQMGTEHLLTFLYPEALGTPLNNTYEANELWEDVGYFGLVPLLLAAVAVVLGLKRRATVFLAICFGVSVLLSFDTPVLQWIYDVVPGFDLFRIPQRYLFLAALFGIALAGIGLQSLLDRLGRRKTLTQTGVACAVGAIVLVAAEGTYYARRYLTMAPQEKALPSPKVKAFFAADDSLYRVASLGKSTLNFGWSAPLGIQSICGYDGFNFRHYLRYVDLMQYGSLYREGAWVWFYLLNVSRPDMLDALNVKYFVTPRLLRSPPEWFKYVAVIRDVPVFVFYRGIYRGDLHVYLNTRHQSRAFWAGELVTTYDEQDMLTRMVGSDLHRSTFVLNPAGDPLTSRPSPDDRVDVVRWIPGRMTLRTHSAHERFLVVSEVWDPGWRIRVDGRRMPVYRANITMFGTAVPAGDHEVTVEYLPPLWTAGVSTTLVGGAVVVTLVVVAVVKRRSSHKAEKSPQRPAGAAKSRS